jgi:hypothetical protein
MAQLHKLCCTITVPLNKAYIGKFTIDIVLLTSYTRHICISMWGAVGSGAVDVDADNGAQMARAQMMKSTLSIRFQLWPNQSPDPSSLEFSIKKEDIYYEFSNFFEVDEPG